MRICVWLCVLCVCERGGGLCGLLCNDFSLFFVGVSLLITSISEMHNLLRGVAIMETHEYLEFRYLQLVDLSVPAPTCAASKLNDYTTRMSCSPQPRGCLALGHTCPLPPPPPRAQQR